MKDAATVRLVFSIVFVLQYGTIHYGSSWWPVVEVVKSVLLPGFLYSVLSDMW